MNSFTLKNRTEIIILALADNKIQKKSTKLTLIFENIQTIVIHVLILILELLPLYKIFL